MLKIKDNVDLKELEKYGYEYKNNWEELKKYIQKEWKSLNFSDDDFISGYDTCMREMSDDILNKMKELEEDK